MTPAHGPARPVRFAGEKEPHAQRDHHEKVSREVVSVDKGPRGRRNQVLGRHMKDMTVAAEEFEHPVEGIPKHPPSSRQRGVVFGFDRFAPGPPAHEKEK